MKIQVAALLLSSLFATSAMANSSALSGTYELLSSDCIVGGLPKDAIDASKIKIEATDSQVAVLQTVKVAFAEVGEGDAVLAQNLVGDFSSVMLGGGTYRTHGVYSNDETSFSYSEYDNQAPGLPLEQLRATRYELTGPNLTITQSGDVDVPRVCKAVKTK